MWHNKKPNTTKPASPESCKAVANRPPDSTPEFLKGLTSASGDTVRSLRLTDRLGSSWRVKGEIFGKSDLLLDGSIEGLVQLQEGQLTIGTTAEITADIIADSVVVYGNVKGNIRAKDRIEIRRDASVTGDLTTPQIMIEDGAYFKGSIEIVASAEKDPRKDPSPRTAPAAKAAGVGPKSI